MKNDSKKIFLTLMREEWNRKTSVLRELQTTAKIDGVEKNVISKGLKVKHKKTLRSYTVKDIDLSNSSVTLTADGEDITVTKDSFKNEYTINADGEKKQ